MDIFQNAISVDAQVISGIWRLDVEIDDAGFYAGTVSRCGTELVRITLTNDGVSAREAAESLADKARLWVRHYLRRYPVLH